MGNFPNLAFQGQDWQELSQWLTEELGNVHKRLASLETTPEMTQILRGRASLINQMLDWPSLQAATKPPFTGI
jgi:hypothetical protein